MKNLLFFAALSSFLTLNADMKVDPIGKVLYSVPHTPEINQAEYHAIVFQSFIIMKNMEEFGVKDDNAIFSQLHKYLICSVKTSTAIRAYHDLVKLNVDYKKTNNFNSLFL